MNQAEKKLKKLQKINRQLDRGLITSEEWQNRRISIIFGVEILD